MLNVSIQTVIITILSISTATLFFLSWWHSKPRKINKKDVTRSDGSRR